MTSPSFAHPLLRGAAFPGPRTPPPPRHLTGASLGARWIPVRKAVKFSGGRSSRVRSLGSTEESGESTSNDATTSWGFFAFRAWDVPWDWTVTALVMTPYLMSILLSGVVKLNGMEYPLPQLVGDEEVAVKFFADQFLKTIAKLSVLYMFVSRHQPFPDDIFSFRWNRPFHLQNGWILWAAGGLFLASGTVFLVKALVSGSIKWPIQPEGESLVRLLPLIGLSDISTISLIGVVGILAPISEEILYRGFFMTSLTKWLPPHLSIFLSSAVFALAHQSPGESLEIFIFGIVLGTVYAQTRNLLTPICMHAFWNVGIILTLTLLQLQGHEIQEYAVRF